MSSESNTKFVILVPDGMADTAKTDTEIPTPLQTAKTPWMDKMASCGDVGLTFTVPKGMEPGSDVANLAIMGYAPAEVYTGRAPFEAASMGVSLQDNDVAFRMNFVTLDRNYTEMADHSADHISTHEAHELIKLIKPIAERLGLALYPGVSYRNLLVWKNGPETCFTRAPHDILGEPIAKRFPTGAGADTLLRLIIGSWKVLEEHPINLLRIQRCQGPANSVWPWGQGRPPRIKKLKERFGISGAVIAAVDLVRGIGKYAGLDVVDVPGATGYMDTNYTGKVDAAINQLREKDFVLLHVEAPDEAGHSGQGELKIKAIEDFDEKVVGPMIEGLKQFSSWRILLMPDHCTPISLRTHTSEPVPYILLDSAQFAADKDAHKFSETSAARTGKVVKDASTMIDLLLKR